MTISATELAALNAATVIDSASLPAGGVNVPEDISVVPSGSVHVVIFVSVLVMLSVALN
jgi:hypothetical protein